MKLALIKKLSTSKECSLRQVNSSYRMQLFCLFISCQIKTMQWFLKSFSNIRTSNRTFALLGDTVNKKSFVHNKTSSSLRPDRRTRRRN